MANNGKASESGKRSYSNDLSRAERNCRRDMTAALVLFVVFTAAAVWILIGYRLPSFLTGYRLAACSAVLSGALIALIAAFSALSDRRACRSIIRDSVYAVRLTSDQQRLISRTLASQSAKEHFLCYSAVLSALSVILILSYVKSGNSSSLIVLSVTAVAGLCVTLVSYAKDVVRTASDDGFCTVSGKGIIQAGKVIPFRSGNGDVLEMIRFDDCYSVRFITGGVLGLMVNTDFPLPKGGSVSRTLIGAEEEPVLLTTLKPGRVRMVDGDYRQLPFDSGIRRQTEEETVGIPDESRFLKFAAYVAVALLTASAVMEFLP